MLALVLAVTLTAPPDVIPPGRKPIDHDIRIEGLEHFPDHDFFLYYSNRLSSEARSALVPVHSGDRVPFAKYCDPMLHAVKRPAPDLASMPEADCIRWLEAHAAVADQPIEQIHTVAEWDPRDRIRTAYLVTAIDGAHIQVVTKSTSRAGTRTAVTASIAAMLVFVVAFLWWRRKR